MLGSIAALCQDHPRFEEWWTRLSSGWVASAAAVFLLFISPLARLRFKGTYDQFLSPTLQSVAILIILFWLVRRPNTRAGRCFNFPAITTVGLLSYSLYLWQQLFLFEESTHWWMLQRFPVNFICCFAAAFLLVLHH